MLVTHFDTFVKIVNMLMELYDCVSLFFYICSI